MKSKKTASFLFVFAVLAICGAPARADADKTPANGAIAKGHRGFTVVLPGAELSFIGKGDRLDVLVTFDTTMKDSGKERVTATILQNVVVLDVRHPGKLDEKGAVELEMNPNETQYAALAMREGEIHLARRAKGDMEMKPMEMAAFSKLMK